MPKEREREREKEGLNAQTHRERERERLHRRTHSLDHEPRNRQTYSSPIIANPEIVKPIRHRSLRTQKSSNLFVTDHCEPRNRQTHSPPIVANPEIVTPFIKPKIVPLNCWSACSRSILPWVDLVADLLALFDLWFSFCCCGGVGGSCFIVLWFWVDLWFDFFFFFVRYWEFGFWWIWVLLDLMIYLFGSWENVRNMRFSRAFSRI